MNHLKTTAIAATGAVMALLSPATYASTFTTLYSFAGQSDGSGPFSPLLAYRGALYGVTNTGGITKKGTSGYGTLFKFDPATFLVTTIYTFKGPTDAAGPSGSLVAFDGKVYGTSFYGGANNLGAVFGIAVGSGHETSLYSFAGGTDGSRPASGLTFANHSLFGTTSEGGNVADCTDGCGTIYTIDPASGAETVVHVFDGAGGAYPKGDLVLLHGRLQGTTVSGGTKYGSDGTVFSLDPVEFNFTLEYSFTQKTGPLPISLTPKGSLIYGTELSGNPDDGVGSLFSVNIATGHGKSLYRFQGKQDGAYPQGAMVALGGLLYGTTIGNSYQDGKKTIVQPGSIYSLDPKTKVETTLYTFPADNAGVGLTVVGGTLYGATYGQGSNNLGSIFSFVP